MSNIITQTNVNRLLCIATLTLLLDAKVLSPEKVSERLQSFLDALPEDQKNGEEGYMISEILKNVRNANGLRPSLSVIES